jgi:hypothetical protein
MSEPIVLRWRIHAGEIPLLRRHLRALRTFELPEPLMAWVHERIEWAKDNMLNDNSEGVLVLNIDPASTIVASIDDVRDLPQLSLADLEISSGSPYAQIKPELAISALVVAEIDGKLVALCDAFVSATATLLHDIAQTLAIGIELGALNLDNLAAAQAVFAISDEFGLLPVGDMPSDPKSSTGRIADAFAKLW